MTTEDFDARPHSLYRFFGSEDVLLYIGLTVNLPTRLTSHATGKPWWHDVVRMSVQAYPDRAAVVEAERLAIIAEGPLHNIQHNKRRRGTQDVPADAGIPAVYRFADFDHSELSETPQYARFREALNYMANALYRLTEDEWKDAIRDCVLTAPHVDNCRRCRVSNWPFRAENHGRGFRAYYRCHRCGDVYTVKSWSYERTAE